MTNSYEFLNRILDTLPENIVVVNELGIIQYVNKSWTLFAQGNACVLSENWVGQNYIEECDKAASRGDEYGALAAAGIRDVIARQKSIFYFEYPCHSPTEKRWFMMSVTPFQMADQRYFVISHQNITERKIAEDEARMLAGIDGITGIPNRRSFDAFLHGEWKRCLRLKKPITLMLIDIDHFKLLNDTYGHQFGDDCLAKVGAVIEGYANRPYDLSARIGGDEFALILGDNSLEQARQLASDLTQEISGLHIPCSKSLEKDYISVSVGLATVVPARGSIESEIISRADKMLYRAKEKGRNRVES